MLYLADVGQLEEKGKVVLLRVLKGPATEPILPGLIQEQAGP